MKRFLITVGMVISAFVIIPNVSAATINVSSGESLSDKVTQASPGDVLVLEDGTYTGDITIDKALTIKGTSKENTIINGQINIASNNALVSLESLTIEKQGSDTAGVKLTGTSNVTISDALIQYANIVGDDYGNNDYFTGIWLSKSANGSTLTVNNSEIKAKYAIWVHGQENNVTVNSSSITGWAALDISNSPKPQSSLAANNVVTVNGSTLLGVATSTGPSNGYGTIVIGGQDSLQLTINNSTVTNKFVVSQMQDLIHFGDAYEDSQNVNIEINSSKLINTDTTTNSSVINYITEGVSANENIVVMSDTTIESANGKVYSTANNYVTVTIDILGVTSTITIPVGSIIPEEALNFELDGYTFEGWYTDENFENTFDTASEVNDDITLFAKLTEIVVDNPITSEEPTEQIENPNTADSILLYVILGLTTASGAFVTYRKLRHN